MREKGGEGGEEEGGDSCSRQHRPSLPSAFTACLLIGPTHFFPSTLLSCKSHIVNFWAMHETTISFGGPPSPLLSPSTQSLSLTSPSADWKLCKGRGKKVEKWREKGRERIVSEVVKEDSYYGGDGDEGDDG